MGYYLQALIGSAEVLGKHTSKFKRACLVTLAQGMGLIPLTDDLHDEIGGDDIGFLKLSSATEQWVQEISFEAPIAYIEAEFFGGTGGQIAIVWSGGSRVLGPVYSQHPINQALRFFGVQIGNAHDEFDAVGLGRHRDTQDWITPKFSIYSSVLKNSNLPVERLRIIQNLTELQIADLRIAVIFVFAAWSGLSLQAFQRLTRLISTLDAESLEVIVLDNDCMTSDDMIHLFGHVFRGAGEVIWVRNGQITAELSVLEPESEALVLSHTKGLLLH